MKIMTQAESSTAVIDDTVTISPALPFLAAMVLAIIADALQVVVLPLFVEREQTPLSSEIARNGLLRKTQHRTRRVARRLDMASLTVIAWVLSI